MTSLLQDLRYAIRMLFKRPGFAAVAILTLGLGIGANTAIFSVVHAVVFRQLPYPNSERLMQLFTQFPSMHFDKFWFSPPEFFELQSWNSSYESVAGWNNGDAAVVGDKEPVRVMASYTTGKLFQTIGVGPAQGHAYADADTLPNAAPVAVLGHGLWQSGFGGDPKILGRKIQVDGVTTEIIGVMPERFDFPDRSVELWLPLTLDPAKTDNRGSHYLSVIGRLKDGVSVEQARSELGVLMAKSGELHKDQHPWSERHPIILQSLHEEIIGAVRPGMLMLLGAVGFVLLIACANVANLMLARAEARQKEIAVRKALGASQRRLVRQLLTESLVLGLVGGLLGLAFARWGLDLILAMNPDIIPRVHEIGIDGRVLLFTLGLSLLTGFIFGLAPVVHIGVGNLHTSLKSATRGSTEGVERQGFRRALVIAEVALAVVLVVGSGLMIRSFMSLLHVEPGFNPKNLVTMELALAEANYPKDQQVVEFYNSLREKVGALPGVKGVTLMSGLPPSRRINANDIEFIGIPQPKHGEEPIWNVDYWQTVATGYFEMMGIRLIEGRLLAEADRDGAAGVVVVNETMAKRFWPGQSAVGKQLKTAPWNDKVQPQTVVGVVADVKQQGLDAPTGTELYMTMDQMPSIAEYADRGMNLVVRSESSDPIKLVPSIRAVIRQMDPTLPVARVRTMDEVFGDAVARPWFLTVLLAAFAMVALVLAAIGIYGLLAFAVAQRTSEIGIRVALGAQRSDVLRLVIGQGMVLVLIGVAVGLGAAFALTRMMQSLLFGVSASDPVTFAAVPLLLIAVALIACLVPAIRALRVDPMIALRYE